MNELISVIIPVYNAEKTLKKCIESIINQTYTDLEIILVDDGSADSSAAICEQYSSEYNTVRVIHIENGGVANARNVGLDLASGKYVTFVDSDDTVEKDFLKVMHDTLCVSKSDMCVIYDFCDYENDKFSLCREVKDGVYYFDCKSAIKSILLFEYFTGHAWGKLFKREIIGDLRLNSSIHFCEDTLFNISYILKCSQICFTPARLYNYNVNENSLSHGCLNEKKLTAFDSLTEIKKILNAKFSNELNPYICYDILLVITDMLANMLPYNTRNEKKIYFKRLKNFFVQNYSNRYLKFFNFKTRIKMRLLKFSVRLYSFVCLTYLKGKSNG